MICGKDKTRPTNLFYFMRGATITVADWPSKFLYNLDASQEFLHWLLSRIGDSQQLEAHVLHQLFLRRRPFLVPSTISILDSRLPYLARARPRQRDQYFKTIAGKPFGRRTVKLWLTVRYLSDAGYITAKLPKRMREKPLRYLRKYDF